MLYLCESMMWKAVLHTGSNLGDRSAQLRKAIQLIGARAGQIIKTSKVYDTEPWGNTAQDSFFNQAILIQTELSPHALMQVLLGIEQDMGRERRERWGARIIDIDLIFYADDIVEEEGLSIPHPRMSFRNFVLAPLAELVPEWRHPVLNKTVLALLQSSTDPLRVVPIAERLPHPFIVIEGNIGAGKTTLCQMISEDYGCRLILEQFADNPFLPYFYNNPDRYAFPVELFFMTERHKQLQEELGQHSLFQDNIVADYFFLKTLLFAKNNLQEDEYRLFQRLFSVLNASFPKPDLLVFLHRPVDSLLSNIHKRGRDYEQEISEAYLRQIQQVYFDFFRTDPQIPILVLDIGESDFQSNPLHYAEILAAIQEASGTGVIRKTIGG
jgi:deoxyguanosine kinase